MDETSEDTQFISLILEGTKALIDIDQNGVLLPFKSLLRTLRSLEHTDAALVPTDSGFNLEIWNSKQTGLREILNFKALFGGGYEVTVCLHTIKIQSRDQMLTFLQRWTATTDWKSLSRRLQLPEQEFSDADNRRMINAADELEDELRRRGKPSRH